MATRLSIPESEQARPNRSSPRSEQGEAWCETGQYVAVDADQVLDVLDRLAGADIDVWVDGGWGVDALLGHRTRDHDDLDLVVDVLAVARLRSMLVEDGFEVARDWLPTAIAFSHPDGRKVDLHPVELTADGGGDQIQLDGVRRWHYDPPVRGQIAGRDVACCSLETQFASHLGYEAEDQDRADMKALAERFGRDLPAPYSDLADDP